MQVSVEASTSLERRLTITVPAEEIDSEVDKKIHETSKTIRIDGFRKGKVPAKLVRKRYAASIRQEVIGDVIQTSYAEALQEAQINPAGVPEIEPKEDLGQGGFTYVAVLEIYPEINLIDPVGLNIERQVGTVTDADVDNMIEILRSQHANWTEVARAAADGDQLNIDFEGSIGGEVFEGCTAKAHDIVLGSGSMIPSFEEGIIGMSAGSAKDLPVNFPEDYKVEHLAGKEVIFKIVAHKVSEAVLPELNDEFFIKFNPKVGGKEGFKAEIRNNMDREMDWFLKTKLRSTVLNAYVELNEFDVPKTLVKEELSRLKQQAIQKLGGENHKIDSSILPDAMFEYQANQRVRVGLLTGEVVKVNAMTVDEDRLNSMVEKMAQGYENPQEFVDYCLHNSKTEQRSRLDGLVLEDMVVEHLLAAANVTDLEVDYATVVKSREQVDS